MSDGEVPPELRPRLAARLRHGGLPWAQIAQQLGVSVTSAVRLAEAGTAEVFAEVSGDETARREPSGRAGSLLPP